jgi:hypothetical protein
MSRFEKSLSKLEKQINWIMVEPKVSYAVADTVTVAFAKTPNKAGHRQTTIRIGNDIMADLKWTLKDKLAIFHAEEDPYLWMICKAAKGYQVREETNSKTSKCFTFMWRKADVNFSRAKKVDFDVEKDKIIFRVEMDAE